MKYISVFIAFFLCACSQTQVHVFTHQLDDEKRDRLVKQLEQARLEVIISDKKPPALNLGNFILYKLGQGAESTLEKLLAIMNESDFPISFVGHNKLGNHEFTDGNIGLYLVPFSPAPQNERPLLLNLSDVTFRAEDCEARIEFPLNQSAVLTGKHITPQEQSAYLWSMDSDERVSLRQGRRVYQYKFLSYYARMEDRDIQMLELVPLGNYPLPFGCHFSSKNVLL